MAETETITWTDLPARPWPEGVEPSADELADYLTSLDREQLVWLLGQQRQTWARESACLMMDHRGRLDRLGDLERRVTRTVKYARDLLSVEGADVSTHLVAEAVAKSLTTPVASGRYGSTEHERIEP